MKKDGVKEQVWVLRGVVWTIYVETQLQWAHNVPAAFPLPLLLILQPFMYYVLACVYNNVMWVWFHGQCRYCRWEIPSDAFSHRGDSQLAEFQVAWYIRPVGQREGDQAQCEREPRQRGSQYSLQPCMLARILIMQTAHYAQARDCNERGCCVEHPQRIILPTPLHRVDECVTGGDSIVTDVLAVVEKMRITHPHHFATLVRIPATFHRIHYDRCLLTSCKNVTHAYILSLADVYI